MATNEVTPRVQELPWMEPIDACQALNHLQPLLLDGMGAHPEARQAYIALGGALDARMQGGRLQLSGAIEETRVGAPLKLLRDLLETHRFTSPLPGFTGGFVGYFGYEFTRAIEPTLPERTADTPDLCLRLCRDVVVFDRAARTVVVICNDLPGGTGAAARIETIRNAWSPPAQVPFDAPDATWLPSMDEAAFTDAVRHVQELIADGDLFQANIATRFQADLEVDPGALYRAVQRANPSPYMALMDFGDHCIVSNSPEQLFAVEDGVIRARPIAGTRRRGRDDDEDTALEQELLDDAKEQAEHTMLVDLLRNDIARVSRPGTVRVPERGSVERYQRVMHLVSRVEGTVAEGTGFIDWLSALFPGGTITGAPKHRACLRIHEAEPVARGPYTGSAGFLSWDQSTAHWNIMIRTMVLQDGKAAVHAGSGIVIGSNPEREWQEAGHKAASLLESASGDVVPATRIGDVSPHGTWEPPAPESSVKARVLLVDNYDSFVHNLADYCAALGAQVEVVRNDADVDAVMERFGPTHIILGPGPGWPKDAWATMDIAREFPGKLPILGVCLGHQALAEATGAEIRVLPAVHGEVDAVEHDGRGLHAGMPNPLPATRYHSLAVVEPGAPWNVTARLADGTVMAMEHQEHPVFGLQYHPESIGTEHGLDILIRFLRTA